MVQRYGDFPNAAIPHIWDIWAIDLVFCNFFFGNSPAVKGQAVKGQVPDIMYIVAQMDELRRRMGVVYPMD